MQNIEQLTIITLMMIINKMKMMRISNAGASTVGRGRWNEMGRAEAETTA